MSAVIKIVKRKEREAISDSKEASSAIKTGTSTIVDTVKSWIDASRKRRQTELDLAFEFRQRCDIG